MSHADDAAVTENMSIAAVDTGRAAPYSPFPTLSNLGHSDDPHGLNAFLLHPEDSLWAYLEPTPARRPRGDDQIEQDETPSAPSAQRLRKQKSVGFFKKSPLGQPPLDASVEQVARSAVRKGLRGSWSFRKDVPDLPATPRSSSTNSVVSSVSSNDSDGVRTPKDDIVTVKAGIAGAKLLDALSASQAKKTRSKSWIGWIGKKRKDDVLEHVLGELQAVEEPPRLAPAIRITSRTGELEAIHYQLRSLSLCKLAALKAPSPHPLADIFNQQIPFAPRRRSMTFPASTNRVRSLASLSPGQSGERIKLLVSLALKNAEAGRPVGVDRLPRSPVRQSSPARTSGLVAFLSRPAFEDRMIVYYPDRTSIVTPSNSNAVASIEFSPHLYALAEAGNLSIPTVTPVAGPVDEVEAQRVVEIAMDVAEDVEAEDVEAQVVESIEQPEPVVTAAASPRPKDVADPSARPSSPPSNPIQRPQPQAGRVFRSSFVAKPVTHSWTDSSDSSESSEAELSDDDEDEPLACVAAKRQQAVVKSTPPPAVPTQSMVKEERREEEKQRRYREEVERSRGRRESARRGEVERKVGMDAAGRPSVTAQRALHSQSRSLTSRSRSSLPASNRPASVQLPVPALPSPPRVRTSSYTLPYNYPTMADRRSQSFYEVPRAYMMPMYPVQPLPPPRAMSMVYPPYMAPTPFPIAPSQSRPSRRHSHLPIQ